MVVEAPGVHSTHQCACTQYSTLFGLCARAQVCRKAGVAAGDPRTPVRYSVRVCAGCYATECAATPHPVGGLRMRRGAPRFFATSARAADRRARPSRTIDGSRLLAHKCASRSRRAQPRASVRPGSASPSRAQVCEHFSGTPLVLAHCTLALRALFIIVNGRHKTKDKLTESRMSRKIHVRFGEWIVVFVKKDCCSTLLIREATFEGHHTRAVQIGLRYGMILFIASEVMFFLAFFWAFFHSSLAPTVEIGAVWPPKGIQVLSPWEVPFLNTLILLSSGAAVTWAHHAILAGYRKQAIYSLCVTILLAILFTGFQCYEYLSAPFTLSSGRATVSSITITRS